MVIERFDEGAAADRANDNQRTRGLATLGVRFEAHPAGWEPPGYGRVPGLPKSREERWPAKPVLYWRDDQALPLYLRQGKTERRDARLAPQLERAERARLAGLAAGAPASSAVARPSSSIPPGLAALTAALANPSQKRRA